MARVADRGAVAASLLTPLRARDGVFADGIPTPPPDDLEERMRSLGYVDRGEATSEAARREAREESGLEIRLDGLVNIYSYGGHAPIIIVYAATMMGGCLACDDEGLEAGFFAADDIPWDALAFQSTQEALREFLTRWSPRRSGRRPGSP